MKFTCPQCNTRYTLTDDKIPPAAALKFTCKKCSHVIRIKRPDASPPARPTAASSATPDGATRVASLAEIQAMAGASQIPGATWHVLVGGQQRGPLTLKQLSELVIQHQVDERSHVWREGMAAWQRMGTLPELAQVLNLLPLPKPAANTGTDDATVTMPHETLQAEMAKLRASKESAPASADPGRPTADLPKELAPASKAAMYFDNARPTLSPFEHEPSSPFIPEPPRGMSGDYHDAPPGEQTRVFMSTAGLFKRRARNRNAAIAAIVASLCLGGLIALDLTGLYTIPGMGAVYDAAGIVDPNTERAVARVESKLEDSTLSAEERDALRQKLLGLQVKSPSKTPAAKKVTTATPPTPAKPSAPQEGIVDTAKLNDSQRAMAADIFGDSRKTEATLKLVDPKEVQTPNLPEGLTQEAIYKVISDNGRSMKLCLEEAFKKGEKPTGRMEMQVTIAPTGDVNEVSIAGNQFRTTSMGTCTMKRIKGWKFPRWNGESVTVSFPYVLSAGF